MAFKLNDVVFARTGIYSSNLVRGKVTKVTPSGRLFVDFTRDTGDSYQCQFYSDGRERGPVNSFSRLYLEPASQASEDLFQIQIREVSRQKRRQKRSAQKERAEQDEMRAAYAYAMTALDGDTDARAIRFREIAKRFV